MKKFHVIIILLLSACSADPYISDNLIVKNNPPKNHSASDEMSHPSKYLNYYARYMISEEFGIQVITKLKNVSNSARYQDIEIRVTYYDFKNAILGTQLDTFYQFILPGGTGTLKTKGAEWKYVKTGHIDLEILHVSALEP